MRARNRGFFASMESDEPIVEVNVEGGVPGDVERDVSDAVSDSEEIGSDVEALEDALDSVEEIEAISDAAEQSVEEGQGLDPVAAEIAEVAVESIYRRLGIPSHVKAMPSMESFGSTNSRKTATRIAIEGFSAQIKAIWAKIVAFFKSVYEKIVSFFKGLFNANAGVNKLLKGLKEKIKDLKGTPEEATFESKRVGSAFGESEGGSFKDKASKVLEAHIKATEGSLKLNEQVKKQITDLGGEVPRMLDSTAHSVDSVKTGMEDFIKAMKSTVTTTMSGKAEKDAIIVGGLVYGALIEFSVDEKDKTVNMEFKSGKEGREEKVGVLSKGDMEALVDAAISLSDGTEKYKAVIPMLKYNNEEVAKLAAKIGESMGKIDKPAEDDAKKTDTAAREALNDIRKYVVALGRLTVKLSSGLPGKNVQACKEVASYVTDSMKQYKVA